LLLDVVRSLDDALRENIHYDYCRRLGQRGALRVFRIARNASATYLAHAGLLLGRGEADGARCAGWVEGRFENMSVPRSRGVF
jgi:hypothetical protein